MESENTGGSQFGVKHELQNIRFNLNRMILEQKTINQHNAAQMPLYLSCSPGHLQLLQPPSFWTLSSSPAAGYLKIKDSLHFGAQTSKEPANRTPAACTSL